MKNDKSIPANILAFKYTQGVPTAEAAIQRQLANLVFTFGREVVSAQMKRAGLGQMKAKRKFSKAA